MQPSEKVTNGTSEKNGAGGGRAPSQNAFKLAPASDRLVQLSKEIDTAVKSSTKASRSDKTKHGGTPRNWIR